MKRPKHKVFKRQKDLLASWLMNIRFRPSKRKSEVKMLDKRCKVVGLPISAARKAKQALIFVLTQIGAFERAGVRK